jgi:conjugal transfer ATP-binding protein TraC
MFNNIFSPELIEKAKAHSAEILDSFKTMLGMDEDSAAKDVYTKSLSSDSMAGLLPYLGWDSTAELFILDEGERPHDEKTAGKKFLGFCLECMPQTGADNSMEDILQSLFIQAPPGTTISVHNYASPNVLPTLKRMATMRYSDTRLGIEKEEWEKRNVNVFQKMARKRIDYYLNATPKPLFKDFANILVRDYRVVMSVVVPANPGKNADIEETMLLREQFKSTLGSANLPCWTWKPDDLINFVADFFDHSRVMHVPTRQEKEYEPYEKIRNQVATREVESVVRSTSIEMHNAMSKTPTSIVQLSVAQYPRFFHLSMMSSMIGDYFQSALSYPCPFMITTSIVVQDYEGMRNKTKLKTATSQRKTEGYMAKIDPLIAEEAYEWKQASRVVEDGGTLIQVSTNITLITNKKDAAKAKSEVMAVWRSKGFRLSSDRYQQLVGFMSSMPLGLTPSLVSDLKKMQRFSTKYSQNAISVSPFIGEWKGSGTPVMTFVGRRGQLVSIDLYDNKAGNYNFAIVGASGSGKSFLTQEVLFSYRANEAMVWVIDVGRSYQNLCHLIDGEFIEFTEEANVCINPFSSIGESLEKDEEGRNMLKNVVMAMMSPTQPLSSWEAAVIEQGITEVYAELGNKMTITDLAEYFNNGGSLHGQVERIDQRVVDMGRMLYPWTRKGSYGKYFDGEANITFKNEFTVLELEELKGKRELQAVVLMIMMFHVTSAMYLMPRNKKKVVMIDEAWELMGGGMTGEFIENGYRRARKYGGAFGTATQNVGDYYKSPAAKAALDNADWRFILRQKEESVDVMEEKGLFSINTNPFKKRTIKDLKKIDGRYSEIYIDYPQGSGVVRFMTEPFTQYLYSSSHEQFERIAHYKRQGFAVVEAVEKSMADAGVRDVQPLKYE